MNNDALEDIAVLKTLARLHKAGLLRPNDATALVQQLKSDWAKNEAATLLREASDHASSRTTLKKFAAA